MSSVVHEPATVRSADTASAESARRAALEHAKALAPRIRERAAAADRDRRLPDETIGELLESGLFGVMTPRIFGGSELGVAALVDITIELARACGSTGWVYGVLAGHSWMLNLFPEKTQREIHANPGALTATVFRLGGTVTRVDGGYRLVDGQGRFCSGIDFASWVIVGNAVEVDGSPPEPRFFVVPRNEIEIVDDWQTVGMRGTGSRSIRIADAFIPAHRSVSFAEMSSGRSPGAEFHQAALYRMPFQLIAPFSIIGAPLGIARGVVEDTSAVLTRHFADLDELQAAGRAASLARLGHSAAEIDAATALIARDAMRIDSASSADDLTALEKAAITRDWAYAAQTARHAASRIFESAGGGAIYDASDLQRQWRDVNAAAQHFAFVWDNALVDYGRAAVGLPAMHFRPGKR